MQKYDLSRNKITKTLQDRLGKEYRACALRVLAGTGAKSADKRRGRSNPHTPEWNAKIAARNKGKKRSEETKRRISEASKTRFERGTWTKEEQTKSIAKSVQTKRDNCYFELHSRRHSEWMKQHAPMRGKKHTEVTRQKMRDAQAKFFENGGTPSRSGAIVPDDVRERLSEFTRQMWAEGRFTYGGGKVKRSKLEKQIFDLIKNTFPDAEHTRWLTLNDATYVFDVYVPSLKTFVEVNGDYWHLNPRLYEATHFDVYRNCTAQEVWSRDDAKRAAARSLGYHVVTVWESEVPQFNPLSVMSGS